MPTKTISGDAFEVEILCERIAKLRPVQRAILTLWYDRRYPKLTKKYRETKQQWGDLFLHVVYHMRPRVRAKLRAALEQYVDVHGHWRK